MRAAFVAAALLVLTGCGTMLSFGEGDFYPYSGVAHDVDLFHRGSTPEIPYTRKRNGLYLLDLPFSLVLDTVALPVTITVWALGD